MKNGIIDAGHIGDALPFCVPKSRRHNLMVVGHSIKWCSMSLTLSSEVR